MDQRNRSLSRIRRSKEYSQLCRIVKRRLPDLYEIFERHTEIARRHGPASGVAAGGGVPVAGDNPAGARC